MSIAKGANMPTYIISLSKILAPLVSGEASKKWNLLPWAFALHVQLTMKEGPAIFWSNPGSQGLSDISRALELRLPESTSRHVESLSRSVTGHF